MANEYSGNVNTLGTGFRADSYTGISSADAATSVLMPQLLKNVFDSGQNATYNSLIAIQNTSASATAHVTLTLNNQTPPIGTFTHPGIQIPPNSSVLVDMQTESSISGASTFYGTGTIASDQPVAVVVNQNAGGVLTVYTGFTNANAATTIYAPQLLKNVYDSQQQLTWGSGIMVMTLNGSTASVTATYVNQQNGHTIVQTKTANPAATFDQRYDLTTETSFYGSVTLTSSTPIVALANMVTAYGANGVRASTYRALTTVQGTNTVFIPQILKNYADSGTGVTWGTGIAVRLLSGSSGTVQITYYNNQDNAVLTSPAQAISPSSPMVTFDQRFDTTLSGESVVYGSAVISSTVPVAATVNGVGAAGTPGDCATTYAGVNQ